MTEPKQPEALRLANEFRLCNEYDSIPSINDIAKAETELRRQHARIAELEAQLESIGASAVSEPVAWLVCTEEGDPDMVFLSQHEAQQYLEDDERPTPLYTHPSPPEGMVGGWMPIETAPKDGTSIIAYRPTSPPHIECMNWCAYEDADIPGAWHWAYDGDAPRENLPTHWMPLPLPPTTPAGSGKGGEA